MSSFSSEKASQASASIKTTANTVSFVTRVSRLSGQTCCLHGALLLCLDTLLVCVFLFFMQLKQQARDNVKAAGAAKNAFVLSVKDPEAAHKQLQSVKVRTGNVAARPDADHLTVLEDDSLGRAVDKGANHRTSVAGGGRARQGSLILGFVDAVASAHGVPGFGDAVPRRGSTAATGHRKSLSYQRRTPEALEGMNTLKSGCPAVKISQQGKQRPSLFRLSNDESKLTWEGGGVLSQTRFIHLADVIAVEVGQKSLAFRRARSGSSKGVPIPEATSLTLRMAADLRASSGHGGHGAGEPPEALQGERRTLDLCVHDAGQFALLFAALEALTTEVKQKPAPYASPLNPVHASAAASIAKAALADATCYERCRDGALRFVAWYAQTRFFQVVTVIWALAVVVLGALFFFLLVGWHGMEQGEAMDLGNVCIQILTAQFSYILFLTLPWRIANTVHVTGCSRSCAVGLDLYGRPTNGIWFFIPPHKRRWVTALAMANAIFQYATQATRIVWPSYADSQTPAGLICINATFGLSIICGMSSGMFQGCCEDGVRKLYPGRFPPTPFAAALAAYKDAKAELQMVRISNAVTESEQELGISGVPLMDASPVKSDAGSRLKAAGANSRGWNVQSL